MSTSRVSTAVSISADCVLDVGFPSFGTFVGAKSIGASGGVALTGPSVGGVSIGIPVRLVGRSDVLLCNLLVEAAYTCYLRTIVFLPWAAWEGF